MKSAYILLFGIGLLWIGLGFVVTFATPPEENLAIKLSREPENWELRVVTESYFLKKPEETEYNELLKTFIDKNHRISEVRRHHGDMAVSIACVFCLVGWIRETKYEKRKGA